MSQLNQQYLLDIYHHHIPHRIAIHTSICVIKVFFYSCFYFSWQKRTKTQKTGMRIFLARRHIHIYLFAIFIDINKAVNNKKEQDKYIHIGIERKGICEWEQMFDELDWSRALFLGIIRKFYSINIEINCSDCITCCSSSSSATASSWRSSSIIIDRHRFLRWTSYG